MLKKYYVTFVFLAAFFITSSSVITSSVFADTNFGIGALVGLGYASNSKMNDVVAGYGDEVADDLNDVNSTSVFKGKADNAGFAYGFDLDARVIGDSFGVGCSLGYQVGGESSSSAEASGYESKQSLSLELSSTVYLLTLYYKHVIDESSFILFGAGPGFYNSKMKLAEEASGFVSGNFKDEYEYTGSTWGGHFKVEYNYLIGSVDIFAGLLGRYAKVSEFEKDGVALTVSGEKLEGNFTGALIYFGVGFMI